MITLSVDIGLRLVQLQADDAEELFNLTNANRAHLRRWLPWLDQTRSVAATAHFIGYTQQEAEGGKALHFAIYDQGIIVGLCGYNRIDKDNRAAVIGYWLGADVQGRGIMSRCVMTLALYGFAKLNLHRQIIAVAAENQSSAAVAERCGFRFEGMARDAEWLYDHYVSHRIYARLRTDA
ncbi:MAG: GNAT family protein [Opitutaceae bacterium]|jgi:ribosomal-protein-serine acetyltransferase